MQTPLDADHPVMLPVMHAGKPNPHWTEGMTHACENITLPQSSFAGGKSGTNICILDCNWFSKRENKKEEILSFQQYIQVRD